MTPTIHNKAVLGEIAKTVLMPGDPVRAKFIAENFLTDAKLVNDVRCAYCYTGNHKGKPVSVMASGMGAGSMGIYSYELFNEYDVDQIIRVGSAGGLSDTLQLGDLVLAIGSSTDSGFVNHLGLPGTFAPTADFSLLKKAEAYCVEHGINVKVGPVFSGAAFHYSNDFFKKWADMGMLAVEMESNALYVNAAISGKKALAMCTIADMVLEDTHMSSSDRETMFTSMIETALSLV